MCDNAPDSRHRAPIALTTRPGVARPVHRSSATWCSVHGTAGGACRARPHRIQHEEGQEWETSRRRERRRICGGGEASASRVRRRRQQHGARPLDARLTRRRQRHQARRRPSSSRRQPASCASAGGSSRSSSQPAPPRRRQPPSGARRARPPRSRRPSRRRPRPRQPRPPRPRPHPRRPRRRHRQRRPAWSSPQTWAQGSCRPRRRVCVGGPTEESQSAIRPPLRTEDIPTHPSLCASASALTSAPVRVAPTSTRGLKADERREIGTSVSVARQSHPSPTTPRIALLGLVLLDVLLGVTLAGCREAKRWRPSALRVGGTRWAGGRKVSTRRTSDGRGVLDSRGRDNVASVELVSGHDGWGDGQRVRLGEGEGVRGGVMVARSTTARPLLSRRFGRS